MSVTVPVELRRAFAELAQSARARLVVMTGAGISAESGIPTFRGKDGYWTIGSAEYHPQEMATHAMFAREPEAVWSWYLYRRGVCRAAEPNVGHDAVVEMERALGDRFCLITQNVDGLHLIAGNSQARTYEIHGNIDFVRCDVDCGRTPWRLDDDLGRGFVRGDSVGADVARLRCPGCGGWGRPHVLWFDEYYDEAHFRFDSSRRAAVAADVLLVVGTSGATNLPMQVGAIALQKGALIVDINPEPNPFSQMALAGGGSFLRGSGGDVLPELASLLRR
ncbi:MAG: RNA polymerase subunit sigma [Myxococcales bacterium]|nr:RNA polymerase subunit sigma [Myxococcales bacterium]